ncbi:MAG: PQQ-binding-like beta-propeller repeat protein [Phycisphaerae bacterium]|nr:PQQ-binding-like beta-propeller repeat protein [Phycisphaerae bacterium]
MTQTTEQARTCDTNPWYQAARTTAIVGAVFSAIFTVLLVVNLVGSGIIGPWRENKLAAMKVQVQKDSTNQELLAEIRQLDLKTRRDRFWRLEFADKATHMLLVSIIVLVVAGKLAGGMAKEPPRPQPVVERGEWQVREAKQARRAVAGGLAVVAVGMLLLAMTQWVSFVQGDDGGSPYASAEEKHGQWHRFRGPGGAGVSAYTNVPTSWNGKTGEGILWKTPVPLKGHNSPVVWQDRVFLSAADPNARQVLCFDGKSGRLLWTGDVPTVPPASGEKFEIMEDTGYAACTVATDGRRVYAIFPTGDVAGFDFNGRRLWHKSLGRPDSAYGYASSLETYEKFVLIQYDQGDGKEGKSRFFALDGLTGQVAWETKRQLPSTWTTPIVVDVAGKPQLITVANPFVVSYNPADGKELWRADCVGGDLAPSPIYAGGLVFAVQPYAQMVAIKPTGQGDVTKTHVAWKAEDGIPDICSPVSDGTYVYLLDSEGLITCYKVEDGKKVYEHELKEQCRASPSVVGDKLYILTLKGVMHIVQAGPEYKELGKCELGEECFASPAFVDGRIYLRGAKNLYCIGQALAGGGSGTK